MASCLAALPSSPYRRAANSRFSIGLSFLKKAASTLTRLISRLTAISSRSMSWPKTSTRPLSRVSSPLMRRMSVDLPEPLAPRIPWMSPRSRRRSTSVIAATGLRLPADDEGLADALDEQRRDRRVGGRTRLRDGHRSRLQLFDEGGHDGFSGVTVVGGGVPDMERAAGLAPTRSSGGLAARGCPWCRGIKKAGALVAHGSWFAVPAVLPPCSLARDGHTPPAIRSAIGRHAQPERGVHRHSETASR